MLIRHHFLLCRNQELSKSLKCKLNKQPSQKAIKGMKQSDDFDSWNAYTELYILCNG